MVDLEWNLFFCLFGRYCYWIRKFPPKEFNRTYQTNKRNKRHSPSSPHQLKKKKQTKPEQSIQERKTQNKIKPKLKFCNIRSRVKCIKHFKVSFKTRMPTIATFIQYWTGRPSQHIKITKKEIKCIRMRKK